MIRRRDRRGQLELIHTPTAARERLAADRADVAPFPGAASLPSIIQRSWRRLHRNVAARGLPSSRRSVVATTLRRLWTMGARSPKTDFNRAKSLELLSKGRAPPPVPSHTRTAPHFGGSSAFAEPPETHFSAAVRF